jgi:hypothetical protein
MFFLSNLRNLLNMLGFFFLIPDFRKGLILLMKPFAEISVFLLNTPLNFCRCLMINCLRTQ